MPDGRPRFKGSARDRVFAQHGVALVAQSPTLFSGLYGLGVAFAVDSRGVPTSLYVKHVSGDYRFAPAQNK